MDASEMPRRETPERVMGLMRLWAGWAGDRTGRADALGRRRIDRHRRPSRHRPRGEDRRMTKPRQPFVWGGARQPTTRAGAVLQWGVGLAVWGGFVVLVLDYAGAL
jgi:hypothetical protein